MDWAHLAHEDGRVETIEISCILGSRYYTVKTSKTKKELDIYHMSRYEGK